MCFRYYINLQKIYQAKAESDCLAMEHHVRSLLKKIGRDPESISKAYIKNFCKNARKLSVSWLCPRINWNLVFLYSHWTWTANHFVNIPLCIPSICIAWYTVPHVTKLSDEVNKKLLVIDLVLFIFFEACPILLCSNTNANIFFLMCLTFRSVDIANLRMSTTPPFFQNSRNIWQMRITG